MREIRFWIATKTFGKQGERRPPCRLKGGSRNSCGSRQNRNDQSRVVSDDWPAQVQQRAKEIALRFSQTFVCEKPHRCLTADLSKSFNACSNQAQ